MGAGAGRLCLDRGAPARPLPARPAGAPGTAAAAAAAAARARQRCRSGWESSPGSPFARRAPQRGRCPPWRPPPPPRGRTAPPGAGARAPGVSSSRPALGRQGAECPGRAGGGAGWSGIRGGGGNTSVLLPRPKHQTRGKRHTLGQSRRKPALTYPTQSINQTQTDRNPRTVAPWRGRGGSGRRAPNTHWPTNGTSQACEAERVRTLEKSRRKRAPCWRTSVTMPPPPCPPASSSMGNTRNSFWIESTCGRALGWKQRQALGPHACAAAPCARPPARRRRSMRPPCPQPQPTLFTTVFRRGFLSRMTCGRRVWIR